MSAKTYKIFLGIEMFLFGIIILVGLCRLTHPYSTISENHTMTQADRGFTGYYSKGTATIKIYKVINYDEYLFTANHEYGHYVYDYLAKREDLKSWIAAINKCGIETPYAKTYRTKTTRILEEWAESYALMKANRGIEVCQQKINVLQKYAN